MKWNQNNINNICEQIFYYINERNLQFYQLQIIKNILQLLVFTNDVMSNY